MEAASFKVKSIPGMLLNIKAPSKVWILNIAKAGNKRHWQYRGLQTIYRKTGSNI